MFSALLTDLYQLTMLQAYFDRGMNQPASFEFFVRKLPAQRNFLMAAGLEQVLEFLGGLRFGAGEIEWLAGTGRFKPAFLRSLEDLRFTGDVWAMAEGTVFFPDEPILRITAPLREAQLVESRVINLLNFQTMVASKAARCVLAAPGRLLVDFGLRRAHAGEAGLLSARASYLAGFSGSATVLAGMRFGIPLYGTMAHSFVQAHDDEEQAFEDFAVSQPGNVDAADRHLRYRGGRAQGGAAGGAAGAARHRHPGRADRQRRPRACTRGGCAPSWTRAGARRCASSPAATSTSTSCATCWTRARRSTASASARG